MSITLRLLILEDDPIDAELELAALEEAGYACQWERVETRAEFLACLDAPDYDAILVDYNLPTFDGLTALHLYLERDLDLPFIFVSGTMGEETAIESLKAGATDYVLKERLSRLGPVVERALHEREKHRRHKQVEEELQKNRQLLHAIVDHSPAAIQIKDLDGHYLLVNNQIEMLFGLQRGEAIGKTPHDIFPQEIAKKFLADDQDALKAETAIQTEEIIPLPDGIHTFIVLKFPLVDATSEPYAVAGISTDITEQKRAEEALRQSDLRFRSLVEQTTDAVFCYEYDPPIPTSLPTEEQIKLLYEGFLAECNDVAARSYGATRAEEVVGKKLTELFGTDGDSLDDFFRTFIQNDYRIIDQEGTEILADGTKRYYLNNGYGVLEGDKLLRVWGTFRNITDRKRGEEDLRDSRRRLRAVFDQTFQFMGMMTPDGILAETNQTALDFAGLEESDVIGKPFWETPWWTHSPELQEQLRNAISRAAAGEFVRFEANHLAADGSLHYADFSLKPVRDEAGDVSFLIPEGRDITKRIHSERALRIQRDLGVALSSISDLPEALNQVLKTALKMAEIDSGGVYLFDALTGELDLAAHTGMSAEFIDSVSHYAAEASNTQIVLTGEPTYMHSTDFAPDMREPMLREGLHATAIIPVIYEKHVIASLNLASHVHDEIPVSTRNALETIGTQIAGVIARIEAVQALQASEERYRVISELTSDITYAVHVEPDGTTVPEWTTGAVVRITGFDADGLVAHGDWPSILHPDDLPLAIKHLQIHLTGQPDVAEYRIITKDGETRWLRDYGHPIWDKTQNRVVRIIGAAQDITERKRAEEALRKQQDLLSHVMETSPAGITMVNRDGQITFANARAKQVLGLTEDKITQRTYNDPEWRITDYDSNPFPNELLPFAQVMSTGQSVHDVRHAIEWPDGRRVLLSINAAPLLNEVGQVDGMVATVDDVTQQVQAEQALRESEQRFRNIVESTPLGMHMYSLESDGRLIFTGANPAANRILGVDNSQFVGETIEEAFPALTQTEVPQAYRQVATEGQNWQTDQITYEEGQIAGAFEVHAFQTSPGKMAAAFLDITDRKRAEEALRESEERFRSLSSMTSEGVMIHEGGTILDANQAFAGLAGYQNLNDLIGKKGLEIIPFTSESRQIVLSHMRADSTETYDIELTKPDGTIIPAETCGKEVTYRGRQARLVFMRDITERKQAEEEREHLLAQVQEQAQRVQQIIETVPEGVILLDSKNRIILANPLGHKDLAILADTLVGGILTRMGDRPLVEFLTSPPQGLWHEVSAEGQTFQVIARPIETGPTPGGWVLVVRDITQQREIERRVHQQERLAAVGQLAAGIAHDFNNIMAVISLYAGMSLRTVDLPEKIYERLETIDQQAHRASDLIQQILDFSRRAVLERLPMELGLFLKEQVKLLRRTLPENIKIDLIMGSDEYTVNADLTRVQQMIMNLATNARDSMPEGGHLHIGLEKVWIASPQDAPVSDMEPGEWVCITIADTGCGIPSDVLPHIYDPFFTTKPVGMGTGLGLSQVYGIVKQHEGSIDVKSQEEKGTTFTIYLPSLTQIQPEPVSHETEALVQGQGQLILVVEDDAATRAALVDSLELLNYRVIEATNGREALSIFEQHASRTDAAEQIALVLSDMVMPEMGGKALLHALRERSETAKVILLTGHPLDDGTFEDLKPQGLQSWLLKPLSIERLSQVVAEATEE